MGGHVAHQVYKDQVNRGPLEKEIYSYHAEKDCKYILALKRKITIKMNRENN